MEPIKLEVILSDGALQGLQSLTTGMQQLNNSIQQQVALVQGLEQQLGGLQKAFEDANAAGHNQEQNIEIVVTLQQEIVLLKKDLTQLGAECTDTASQSKSALKEMEGSFSALSDTMGVVVDSAELLGLKNEALSQAQKRLQAVMAITQGLQKVANFLNQQGIITNSALTGSTNILSAATSFLGRTFGLTAVQAQIAMASMTLGLSAIIAGIVAVWGYFSDKEKQAKESADRLAESEKQQRESVAEGVASQLVEYKKLQEAYKGLGDDMKKKQKFVDDNKDAFERLGFSVSSVTDAENLLITGEQAFIRTVNNRALIAASMQLAAEKYKSAIAIMMEVDSEEQQTKRENTAKIMAKNTLIAKLKADGRNPNEDDFIIANKDVETSSTTSWMKPYIKLYNDELRGANESLTDWARNEAEKLANPYMELANKVAKVTSGFAANNKMIATDANLNPIEDAKKGNAGKAKPQSTDENKIQRNIAAAELDAIARIQDQILAIKEDGYNKQRAQEELNFQKTLQKIKEHEEKLNAEYEAAEKAGKSVDKQQIEKNKQSFNTERKNAQIMHDQNMGVINKKEAEENEEAFNTLIAPYRNYQMQLEDLQKKYKETKDKLEESKSSARLKKIKEELSASYNGNVELGDDRLKNTPLKQVSVQRRIKEGSDEMETVEVLVTPVNKKGEVLNQKDLLDYVAKELNGKSDLKSADSAGLLVATNVDIAGVDKAAFASKQKEYNDLQRNKDANADRDKIIDVATSQVEIAQNEAENNLALIFAQKDAYFQAFMGQLVNLSLDELEKALVTAQSAVDNMDDKTAGPNDKAVAKAKVAALTEQVKRLKAENEVNGGDEKEKWKKTAAGIKNCKSEIDNMIGSMDFLDDSTKSALQTASNIAGGAIGMINGIKLLGLSAGESVKSVERASVILAIVGAAIQIMTAIFSMASGAEKRHQQALAEIAANKLAMQREYNLLLLKQSLLMKEATTVFGEQQIAKAARAIDVYRKSIEQYQEELKGDGKAPVLKLTPFNWKAEMASYNQQMDAYKKGLGALNDITIKTGHKKTGMFGWGKGKDIYSSVLSVYPDLIDAEKRLNVERAKTIINTQKMSDENKNLLQHLINLQEQADEAQEALRDYLEETFGSLGDGIMDSITSAIMGDGVDAWELFGEKGAEVLQDLGKQLTYSLFFAEKFAQLQKKLEAVYGSGKSEEEIAKDAMNLVGDFYDEIGSQMDAAQAFMENWQAEGEKRGFKLWQSEGSSQSGQAGSFTSMTQDQGTKLEGLFTSLQDHTSSIDYTVIDISRTMYESSDKLSEIARNTSYCVNLEQMAGDIAELKRDGIKMK